MPQLSADPLGNKQQINMKHSRTVYVCFIVSIVQCALFTLTIALSFLQRWDLIQLPNLLKDILPISLILCVVLSIVGLLVGTIILFKKGKSKVIPTIVLALNGWVILIFFSLIMWTMSLHGNLTGISIDEYGRYEDTKETINTDDVMFVQKTDTIIAVIGTRFGFRYTAEGNPKKGPVPVKLIWVYPSPGAWDSTSRSFNKEISRDRTVFIGRTTYMRFIFDLSTTGNSSMVSGHFKSGQVIKSLPRSNLLSFQNNNNVQRFVA
jgi:hypothetical protein